MVTIEGVWELLAKLDGLDGLRSHINSLVREELDEHFLGPLGALLGELEDRDGTLSEDDRRQLGRLKRLLAAALSAGQDGVKLLTLAAMDAIDGPVRKTEYALARLQAWVRKREASLHTVPKPDDVRE